MPLLLLLLTSLGLNGALAARWSAQIERTTLVEGMTLPLEPIPVKFAKRQGVTIAVAVLEGRFERPGWQMAYEGKVLAREKGNFRLLLPLKGERTAAKMVFVGPENQSESEIVNVHFRQWLTFLQLREKKREAPSTVFEAPKKDSWVLFALGPSIIRYRESNLPETNMVALDGKISYTQSIGAPSWELDVGSHFSFGTLRSNRPGIDLRFFGVDLRIGYIIPVSRKGLRVIPFLGGYYTTTIVTNNAFGFRNMLGPQACLQLGQELDPRNSVTAFAKLATISGLSYANREISFGGGWHSFVPNGHPFVTQLEYSRIGFFLSNVMVRSTAVTFSLGYGI